MKIEEKIIGRLEELIQRGEDPVKSLRLSSMGNFDVVELEFLSAWMTSGLALLSHVFGEESAYYREFSKISRVHDPQHFSSFKNALGVLKSAKEDYEGGYLFHLTNRITADVFADFLEQAAYLLEGGYHQPAAVMAGAVLEDGLRKLCDRQNIILPDKPKLDTMNADLAKSGLYGKLTQKEVTWLADLRNKAAHGQWDEFTQEDVKKMLPGVRSFMEKYF